MIIWDVIYLLILIRDWYSGEQKKTIEKINLLNFYKEALSIRQYFLKNSTCDCLRHIVNIE